MQHGAAVELLARTPVFHGLSGELLGVILQRGKVAYLRAGQTITQAGLPADAALIVIEGTARLQDASGRDLETVIGPGAVLCDMAMLIETSHIHGAVAQSAVTLLGLSRAVIGELMAADPRLAAHFADNIRKNLAATAQTLHQLDSQLAGFPAGPDETGRPASGFSEAPNPAAREHGESGQAANGAANGVANGFGPADRLAQAPDILRPSASVASHFSSLVNRPVTRTAPADDLMAELNGAIGAANQNRSAPGRDRRAGSSPALHQPRAATRQPSAAPALPTHGQAAGRG